MEDTHGEIMIYFIANSLKGPNPYYNGRYSWSGARNVCQGHAVS